MPIVKAKKQKFEAAVGFLNLKIIQADGSEVKLPKGVALRASNRIENAVHEAMKSNPDAVLTIHATYNEVVDTPLELNLFSTPEVVVSPDVGEENAEEAPEAVSS